MKLKQTIKRLIKEELDNMYTSTNTWGKSGGLRPKYDGKFLITNYASLRLHFDPDISKKRNEVTYWTTFTGDIADARFFSEKEVEDMADSVEGGKIGDASDLRE